jgi:hypothetical protein
MTDLLTDPYIEELRRMERYIERQLAWLDTFPTTTADANPCAEGVVGGGLTEQGVK